MPESQPRIRQFVWWWGKLVSLNKPSILDEQPLVKVHNLIWIVYSEIETEKETESDKEIEIEKGADSQNRETDKQT